MPGCFIAFEGGEGAGKSTHAHSLGETLAARGHTVVLTREPGGTTIGEGIRAILFGPTSRAMEPRTEALLMAAARAQHASEVIRPALARGEVVVTDRYIDSSVAYQGAARGLGLEAITDLSAWATQGLLPDLTILLDVPPESGLRRAHEANRMEAEPLAFHQAVRAAMLGCAAAEPRRYLVIDSTLPARTVAAEILARVTGVIEAAGVPAAGVPGGSAPVASGGERSSPVSERA